MRENGEDIKSKISLFCKLKKVKKTWNARSAIATGLAHLQAAVQCYSKFINKNKIPNHFSLMFFGCERPIFSHRTVIFHARRCRVLFTCEDMFFSRVKISSSFHVRRYRVLFTCKDTMLSRVCSPATSLVFSSQFYSKRQRCTTKWSLTGGGRLRQKSTKRSSNWTY